MIDLDCRCPGFEGDALCGAPATEEDGFCDQCRETIAFSMLLCRVFGNPPGTDAWDLICSRCGATLLETP